MYYLVGIDHAYQDNGFKNGNRGKRLNPEIADKVRNEFRNYIVGVINEKEINLVAEESFPEILEKCKATTTMAKRAAESSNVMHLYIEPDCSVRTQLGIPCHPYEDLEEDEKQRIYRVREQYWLNQLHENKKDSVLVICGQLHINTFSKLLLDNGLDVEILENFWGKDNINSIQEN